MSNISKIVWTNATWNPCSGCTKVSRGCDGCYGLRHVKRMVGNLPADPGTGAEI